MVQKSRNSQKGVKKCLGSYLKFENYFLCTWNQWAIQYLLSLDSVKEMSYLTVLPNFYFNNVTSINNFNPLSSSNQNHFNIKNTLILLQSALRISLNNYQLKCPQTLSQQQNSQNCQRSAKVHQQNAIICLEVVQSPLRKKEKSQLEKANSQLVFQSKSQLVFEKDVRKQSQTLTEEQVQAENGENKIKQEVPQKIRGKKVKQNANIQTVISVPTVSLIESVKLPQITPNTLFLSTKKEELLKRQVAVWNTQTRGKKDRREVRMLGN